MFEVARGGSSRVWLSGLASQSKEGGGWRMPILSAMLATRRPPVSSTTSQRPPSESETEGEKWVLDQLPIKETISLRISRILLASFSVIIQWVTNGTSRGRIVNRFRYFFVFSNLYLASEKVVF